MRRVMFVTATCALILASGAGWAIAQQNSGAPTLPTHGVAQQHHSDEAISNPNSAETTGQGGMMGPGGMEGRGPGMMGSGMGSGAAGPGMMGPGMMGQGMMGPGMMGDGSRRAMAPVMMRMMFALIDADGDGTISLQEFQAAHERIFKAMDANKDGKLTPEEMTSFMHGTRMGTQPQ